MRLGIVIAIAATVITIVLLTSGANGSSPPAPGSRQAVTTAGQVSSLLAGIPQEADVLGQPAAPVTLEWFGDLECPFCREFTLGALPEIIQRWVRKGKLRIEYRSMETATRDPKIFETQQIAALAAGEQSKMWYFIELFYHEQGEEDSGYVTQEYLRGIARQIPDLNVAQWNADRKNPELAGEIAEDRRAVREAGFTGTPSFMIGFTRGQMVGLYASPLTSPTQFNNAIERILKD